MSSSSLQDQHQFLEFLDTIGTISSLWFGSSEESFSEEGRRGHNINMWKQIKWKFSSLNQPSKMLFGIVWIVCLTNTFGPRPYSGEPKVAQINALYVVWGALVGGVLVRFPDTHVSRGSPNLTRGALTPGHRWRQKLLCPTIIKSNRKVWIFGFFMRNTSAEWPIGLGTLDNHIQSWIHISSNVL